MVWHRKRRFWLLAALTAVALAVAVSSATAVHDLGLFELDENAVSGAAPGDDWETLAGGGGSSLVDTFVTDPVESPADEILDGGQTKDINNMDEWLWKGAEPNDKNDIEHAFAASYEHSSGDLIVYFGLDRMDNSGDAAAGFWFLKRPVEQKTLDVTGDGVPERVFVFEGTNTRATHSVGDTLVQTDFTNGGSIERIEAYQWGVAPAGTQVQPGSPLRQIATGADCDLAPANDNLCGQVNRNAETVPSNWPQLTVGATTARYFFKGSGGVAASSTFPTATFFEGGINATKLLGSNFCAAQLLAETRQSQSETSTLEDKAEAGFKLCAIDVKKSGPEKSKVGDDATYTFEITNTGAVTLFKQSINDSVLGNLTGSAGCGASLAPGASCTITADYTVQAGDPDPLINTVNVIYNRNSTLTGDQVTDSSSHSTNLFQPSIEVTKTGDELSKIGDVANYTIKVCNTSSADTPDLVKDSVSDNKIAGVDAAFGASLASGACESHDFSRTVQAGDADPLINTATAHYHPDGFTNDITDSDDHSTNLFQPSLTITKTGDTLSKVGDEVKYTIEVCNTSSADSPALVKDSVTDDKIAGVDAAFGASLAFGECESHDFTRTVQAGDADPLVNTATAHYHPDGFPNDISDSDSHSTNLFQPSIEVTKTGDELSKVGDSVKYTIEVCNTSSSDSPNLVKDSVNDTLIAGVNADFGASLAPGACESHDFTRTVQVGDSDPLLNTATAHYHPAGFPNDISDSDGHSTNLFQPSLTITKTGDELSKVGDSVSYTIEVCNTSSADSPNLVKDSVTDNKIAGVNAAFGASLAPGACESHDFTRTVQAGDPDPLINTATAHYHPAGFPNDISDSDSHSTNLFQPRLELSKDASNPFSKAGDKLTYTITISNLSSSDTPNLVLDSFTDSVVSTATAPALCSPLSPGGSCTFTYDYTVQAGDPDPLVNTATAHYKPVGFENDITDSDSATVDLLHPAFTVTKECTNAPVDQGGTASFKISYKNTGDADLVFTPGQPDEGGTVAVGAGQTGTVTVTRPVPDGATSVGNTVSGEVTLAGKYGLSNKYDYSASGSCSVKGKAKVVKTVSGQPPATGQSFTFELRQGASTVSQGTVLESKNTDASGNISFTTQLIPGQTYQICEWVFPGWNTNLAGDGPLFVPESIIPPALPNPNVNNLTVCANFTVTSGQTRTFNVENSPPPGGRALTIGFWKNWASCSNSNGKGQKPMLDLALGFASAQTTNPPGGMVVSAQNPGSLWPNYAATFYLVLRGNPLSTDKNILAAPDCAKAVALLNKSTIDTGKKMSSDPLFNMTAQLVGAQLNRFMGAGISGMTITNIDRAVLLNGKYKFNGISYTPKLTTADANTANCLATQLDNYNNGRPVSLCP